MNHSLSNPTTAEIIAVLLKEDFDTSVNKDAGEEGLFEYLCC